MRNRYMTMFNTNRFYTFWRTGQDRSEVASDVAEETLVVGYYSGSDDAFRKVQDS